MENSLQFKLGAIDLDGTLLTPVFRKVAKKDALALQKALDAKMIIGINTGRAYYSTKVLIDRINSFGKNKISFLSCYNGAYIYDFTTNKEYVHTISKELAKEIYDFVIKYKKIKMWFYASKFLKNEEVESTSTKYSWLIEKFKLAKLIAIKDVNDLESFKINLICYKSKALLEQLFNDLHKHGFDKKLTICFTTSGVIEISPLNTSKGFALQEIKKIYGIKKEETISFGDSFNDKSAFDESGFAVGIKPRSKKLYQHCDAIVYFKKYAMDYAIDKYCLKPISHNKNIKCIFSDLDGTIVDAKTKLFTNETKLALQECVKKDIRLIIASGRGLSDMQKLLNDLDLPTSKDFYIVANNGATIYNQTQKVYLHNETINELDAKNVFNFFLKWNKENGNNCGFIIHQKDPQLLFVNESFWRKTNFKKTGDENIYDQWVSCKPIYIDEYPSDIICYKMLIKFPDHQQAIKGLNFFKKKFPQFKIVLSSDVNLEINKKDVDKGFALKYFSKMFKIPTNNFLVMGDGQNDIEALKLSNYSFVPEKSLDIVKNAATHVIQNNKNIAFVANVLNKFFLFKTKFNFAPEEKKK